MWVIVSTEDSKMKGESIDEKRINNGYVDIEKLSKNISNSIALEIIEKFIDGLLEIQECQEPLHILPPFLDSQEKV